PAEETGWVLQYDSITYGCSEIEPSLCRGCNCVLFLDCDLESLCFCCDRDNNRFDAISVPVSFQTGKGKTAIVAGAMLQNSACCSSCENEKLGARRREAFNCRSLPSRTCAHRAFVEYTTAVARYRPARCALIC